MASRSPKFVVVGVDFHINLAYSPAVSPRPSAGPTPDGTSSWSGRTFLTTQRRSTRSRPTMSPPEGA